MHSEAKLTHLGRRKNLTEARQKSRISAPLLVSGGLNPAMFWVCFTESKYEYILKTSEALRI